jgi:CIC family chloride channel protein
MPQQSAESDRRAVELSPPGFAMLLLALGVAGGVGAVVFRGLIALVHNLFFNGHLSFLLDTSRHSPPSFLGPAIVVVPVVGALIVTVLVEKFAPEARGHGVPEVMDAIHYNHGVIRPVVAVMKAIASAVSIGTGGSVGREGPIIQIGAAFASWIGGLARVALWQRTTLVAAGGAAGIAATFNTPIGGVLFAVEILLPEVSVRTLVPVAIATTVATYVAQFLFGNHPAFAVPSFDYSAVSDFALLPACLGLALVLAVVCAVFIKMLFASEDRFDRSIRNPYLRHAVGMLGVGLIFAILERTRGHYYVEGVGYATILDILHGDLSAPAMLAGLFALKLLATSLTLGSGASGGIFSPALFMGATVGGAYGLSLVHFFPHFAPAAPVLMLAGMAGMVAGATGAPLTAIVMIFEMTLDYGVVLPMTLVVAVTYGGRRFLSRESIYTMKLVRRGHRIPEALHADLHWAYRARDIMQSGLEVLPPDVVPASLELDEADPAKASIIVARGREIYGIVHRAWLAGHREQVATAAYLAELCTGKHITVAPETTVFDLLVRFAQTGADEAVVVGGDKGGSAGARPQILGLVTKTRLQEVAADGGSFYSRRSKS